MKIKHLLASILLPVSFCVLAAPFTVSADGQEVTDVKTGLIWRRCAEGMTASGGTCTGAAPSNFEAHESALTHASTQASNTGVAWRLPNIKELSSIVDISRSNPAIDTVAFPATPANGFWSSSPHTGNPDFTWAVSFSSGSVYGGYRRGAYSHYYYVRLVRAGQ